MATGLPSSSESTIRLLASLRTVAQEQLRLRAFHGKPAAQTKEEHGQVGQLTRICRLFEDGWFGGIVARHGGSGLARTAVAQWIAWWAPEPRRTRGATTLSGEELAQN